MRDLGDGGGADLIEEYIGGEEVGLLMPDDIVSVDFGGVVVGAVVGDLSGGGGADLIEVEIGLPTGAVLIAFPDDVVAVDFGMVVDGVVVSELAGGGGADLIEEDFEVVAVVAFPDDVVPFDEGHLIETGGVLGDLSDGRVCGEDGCGEDEEQDGAEDETDFLFDVLCHVFLPDVAMLILLIILDVGR